MTVATDPARWGQYRKFGPVIALGVQGDPIPQGSKTVKGHTKAGRAILTESSDRLKPWRSHVQVCLEQAVAYGLHVWAFPLDGPVAVDLTFTVAKPKSAPKRRRTWPAKRPDTDKLLRAILDAATAAGVFRDDAQVVEATARKAYPLEHPQALAVPGVYVLVYRVGE